MSSPVLLLQIVEDPLQLSLLLRFHRDEDLGGAAGLAERRALVQRLAVVLDQHVLVITANTHTGHGERDNQEVKEPAAVRGLTPQTAGTERGQRTEDRYGDAIFVTSLTGHILQPFSFHC